jgi:hypothetical protein
MAKISMRTVGKLAEVPDTVSHDTSLDMAPLGCIIPFSLTFVYEEICEVL